MLHRPAHLKVKAKAKPVEPPWKRHKEVWKPAASSSEVIDLESEDQGDSSDTASSEEETAVQKETFEDEVVRDELERIEWYAVAGPWKRDSKAHFKKEEGQEGYKIPFCRTSPFKSRTVEEQIGTRALVASAFTPCQKCPSKMGVQVAAAIMDQCAEDIRVYAST